MFQSFDDLTVDFVDKPTARDMILNNHYSQKWNSAFGTNNIGIFKNGLLLGGAVFGHSMNPKSWESITSVPASQCLELNRLWIDDELGKNTETWLLAQSFDLLREKGFRVIQSFADGRLGVGTIYQAANFTYHGFHTTLFHRDIENGDVYHDTQFTNTARTGMIWRNVLHAEQRLSSFTVNTYRYIKPLDKGARRSIKISARNFPKERTGITEIESYIPPAVQVARACSMAEAIGDSRSRDILRRYLNELSITPDELIAKQRNNTWVIRLRDKAMQSHTELAGLVIA